MPDNKKIEKELRNAKASLWMEGMETSPQLEEARRMVLYGKINHKEYHRLLSSSLGLILFGSVP
jgi:hypothetical protein